MRGLSKLDYTDPARQGAHTTPYVHGEIQDYFKVQINTPDPAKTTYQYKLASTPDGEAHYLMLPAQYPWPSPTYAIWGVHCFITKEWLPRNFVFDYYGGYVQWDAGEVLSIAILKDMGPDFNYSDRPFSTTTPPPPEFVKYALYDGPQHHNIRYKQAIGVFTTVPPHVDQPIQMGTVRALLIRRNEKIFYVIHDQFGRFVYIMPTVDSLQIEDGIAPDRLGLVNYTLNGRNNSFKLIQFGIEEYFEQNIASEDQVSVSTNGTVVNAGNPKDAIIIENESSYIEMAAGQQIEVNMTSGAFDAATWEIQIVSNCSDTNKLDVSFATAQYDGVFTDAIQIGSSSWYHDCGFKINTGWTNTVKHIFYQEIAYLFAYGFDKAVGFKKMKITNNTAVALKVYLVKVIPDMGNCQIADGTSMNYMDFVDPDDAPLGTPGTVKYHAVGNTSGFTWLTVYAELIDDGSPELDGLIEFSNTGIETDPWYSTASPPPGGKLLIGSGIVDGDPVPFYTRTNLPDNTPQLASFLARFKFEIQT